ncbi:unnamed protein product [Linum trigynum]|uniref:Uncharacterized protein n=1 Tax=Linum trigynum TaxID=586398 RepID=A0AAV2F7R8_9ROSI
MKDQLAMSGLRSRSRKRSRSCGLVNMQCILGRIVMQSMHVHFMLRGGRSKMLIGGLWDVKIRNVAGCRWR